MPAPWVRCRPSTPPPLLLLLVLPVLLITLCACEETMLAPEIVEEPAALVQWALRSGTTVTCAARADPPPHLAWIDQHNVPLQHLPGLRILQDNGTLQILASESRAVPPPATVRCRAANIHGVTLSRDVILQPVNAEAWEAETRVWSAPAGGVAAFTCAVTDAGSGGVGDVGSSVTSASLVTPALWYKDDAVLHIDPPTPESRYVLCGSTLLLRGVSQHDVGQYSCLARHSLTAATRRAAPAALHLTSAAVASAPRLALTDTELTVHAGQHVCLPCVAAEHPAPQYTWYREREGRLQPVEVGAESWSWSGGAAWCVRRAGVEHAGLWICKAYNVFGEATAHVRLAVRGGLTVRVWPRVLLAAAGEPARFSCAASHPAASLTWLHDAAPAAAGAGATLALRSVTRAHRGVYQCVARLAHDSAQAAAELRLGEFAPELHYTFIEQAVRPGGSVSLRCAASGAPPPRITWLVDDQPLEGVRAPHRYAVSEGAAPAASAAPADVVSVLNMSALTPADGGRYTCRAHNRLGHAQHSARLNIYGPPSIRALGPVRVVAGANATIYCPYAGYPISSISWWRRGASVAVGGAGGVGGVGAGGVGAGARVSARGAALLLTPALPQDAGHYACAVAAPHGPAARRDIEIQVRNPPKISPFMFSSDLTEGSSAQVLCGVSSGDKPMYFSWLKDGAPLPHHLQIEEKSLNEFSLLMFSEVSAAHSGAYTCRVSNHAATVNYTATLNVKVAPSWSVEPADAAVLVGAPLRVTCAAHGHPAPSVLWYRRLGQAAQAGGSEGAEQWAQVGAGQWGSADAELRANNGSLSSAAAARDHAGLYRCVADNGVGPPLHKHVNVTVHEPAHIEGSGGNVSCVRGQSATLACEAHGDAPLTLTWTHRGTPLDLASYRWTVTEARTASGLRSTLQLRAAERGDAGEYRCHAHNQYGRTELLMYLHVEEPPEAPRQLQVLGVGARWVRLQWRVHAAPASSRRLTYTALCSALHSHAPTLAQAPPNNITLHPTTDRKESEGVWVLSARVEGLRPAAAYTLRLTAANHVGESPHSEPLIFTTLDDAPSASPQNVRVRAANPGELHVSWSAPPQDSWNGELLGYVAVWRETGAEGGMGAGTGGRASVSGWSSAHLTLDGLRPFTRLAITLRAYNRAGASPHSPTIYATTPDGVPEEAPGGVVCEAVSARALRLRWTPLSAAHVHALRSYDIHYAPVHATHSWVMEGEEESWSSGTGVARAGPGGEATLQGLRPDTNYSVWVRARCDAGAGPPAPPARCSTRAAPPPPVRSLRALPAASAAVRVTWRAPAPRLTHYTLYTRELGKVGGEWAQRVDMLDEEPDQEVWREVRGLRERTVYEFWVSATSAAGAGPPSRPVTAAPSPAMSARISSVSRAVWAVQGSRVRLRCAAVGAPPLRWRWSPLPTPHTLTEQGDLIIHKAEPTSGGNYTCEVRNALGSDTLTTSLHVLSPPAPPALRLLTAHPHALALAWDHPHDNGAHIIGYTLWWSREEIADNVVGTEAQSLSVPPSDTSVRLSNLACGAPYRLTLQAHNAVGASQHSPPLTARTAGHKAKPPPGKEFVWANSTALRLNLLAWGGRCPVTAWAVSVRAAGGGTWRDVQDDGESAAVGGLTPGTWHELRVLARSPAGDSAALYRAATHTLHGERLGEAVRVMGGVGAVAGAGRGGGAALWRAGLAPALLAAGLAALLAALTGAVLVRRRAAAWCRRECSPRAQCALPHPQLYTTEPSKRNGKALTPPDVGGDLHEISPYATFSMSSGAGGGDSVGVTGCALHLRTFARAELLDLAAPPRPHLAHAPEYGRARDSDSESSESPCATCAAELYRLPAARLSGTLPAAAVESSAEESVYNVRSAAPRGKQAARARRRHSPAPPTLSVGRTRGRSDAR